MDLLTMRVPVLLLLTALSGCFGSGFLPDEINGVRGRNVTFKITIGSSVEVLAVSMAYKQSPDNPIRVFSCRPPNPAIVAAGYNGRIFLNSTTLEVTFGPLTQADSGIYTLSVTDKEMFQLPEDTTLVVLEPVADVLIVTNLRAAVEFNDTVILNCVAKGSSLNYRWLNGSVPIVADGKHLVFNGSQLIITGVLRTDLRGPIFCIAENKMESQTSSAFNLSVSYGPESIVMTKLPDSAAQKKGSNLTLSCSVVSSPAAELKWLFNGAELPQKEATLSLTNLAEMQSGNYSCLAYNTKTKRSAVSQVATVSVIESISGTNVTASSSVLIAGNSTVNLTCRASGGKADSVAWFKEDKPLADTDRISFTTERNTITIVTVQKEDAGVYRCQLTNKVNSDFSSYKMEIAYGPEKAKINAPTKVEVGTESVVMKCEVASFPPVTCVWKLNGTLLESSSAEYKIEKPDYKNTGTYTCEARNSVTGLTQTATHSFTVKGQGELNDQLSDGAIAAIVIAVLLVVAIIIAVIVRKRRKNSDIPSPY